MSSSHPTSLAANADLPRDGRDARWAAHCIARRRELVDATLRAIRHHGAGVGMDEIAAEAHTSKTVIYRHLGDRQGLYLAVCESVDARILGEIDHAATASAASGQTGSGQDDHPIRLAVLRAVIDSYLKLVERDPEVYRYVVRRPQVQLPEGADPVTGLSSRIAENLTTLLRNFLTSASGSALSTGEAQVLAWALVGTVKESADRWLESPDGIKRSELADQLARFASAGLRGAIPGTKPPKA